MAGLAILCSGQGRQSSDMFDSLRQYPEAAAIERKICSLGFSVKDSVSPALLFANHYAQPLICLYQIMAWSVLAEELPEVELFAGYSLGELSAYACAGFIDADTLLYLASTRGQLMSAVAQPPQGMLAVLGLTRRQVKPIADEFRAFTAIRNGEQHLIFGMKQESIDGFRDAVLALGATRVVRLPVSVAAHTPFLKEAAQAFDKELKKVNIRRGIAPVLSGIGAERIYDRSGMLAALSAQIQQTIDWQGCLEAALACGCRVFLELGPGNSLARMLHEDFPNVEVRALSEFNDPKAAAKWAQKALQRQGR